MSRIINRLVEASGGWERFLYQTLKDVCASEGCIEIGSDESIEEAKEILVAYEELNISDIQREKTQPNQIIPTPQVQPVVEDVGKVVEASKPAEPENVESAEISIFEPAPRPEPKTKGMEARVAVDSEVGASQGELPIPTNHIMVNKRDIVIGTLFGLELGRGSEDGQVRGKGVSGHISSNGHFRLAFKDTDMGMAALHYEVVELPSKMTRFGFEEAVSVRNKITVEQLRSSLPKLNKVVISCGCSAPVCFGWRIEDSEVVEQQRIEELQKMEQRKAEGMVMSNLKQGG